MAEKTEEPTPKKIKDAREEGNVARSKELSESIVLFSLITYFFFAGHNFLLEMMEMFVLPSYCDFRHVTACLRYIPASMIMKSLLMMAPLITIVIVMSIIAEITQIGFLFASKKMKLDFAKFNVVANAKNMVSGKTLVNLFKMIIIAIGCTIIIWKVILTGLPAIFGSIYSGVGAVLEVGIQEVQKECIILLLFFGIVAVLDFLYQRWSHHKQLMMTRQEVMQENKDDQGNPEIKQKRKELHQEMMQESAAPEKTQEATAVVTNPTHYAVAIFYDKDITPLPMVIAKGKDLVAKQMIEVAKSHNIPVIHNVPLARGLSRFAKVSSFVPMEFLEPVAHVLKIVREIKLAERMRQVDAEAAERIKEIEEQW